MPWLTPDENIDTIADCRSLAIPANYSHAVYGALKQLTQLWNWEEHGDDTAAEAVEKMASMLDGWEDGCMFTGVIVAGATDGVPAGWLLCDGAEYDRVDWPILYAALDPRFIIDADTFEVPDMRGRSIVGVGRLTDGELYTPAEMGGEEYHQLTVAEMPAHTHTIHTHGVGLDIEGAGVPDLSSSPPLPSEPTSSAGSDTEHENRMPYFAAGWMIKAL